jgi:hypothetical protein
MLSDLIMRSNALFGGLLKPVPQEALSSWLVRGGQSKNYLPFLRAMDCLKRHDVQDADIALTAKVEEVLSKTFGLPIECLRQSFPVLGDWLKIPPFRRNQFCEHCLYDDFRSGRQPSLRSTWFYWWFTVCPVHGCLLIDNPTLPISKSGISASDALFNLLQWGGADGSLWACALVYAKIFCFLVATVLVVGAVQKTANYGIVFSELVFGVNKARGVCYRQR